MARDSKPKIDRRSLLLGAGAGVGGAAVLAAGGVAIKSATANLITPSPLPAGKPPRIATSFKDSRPGGIEMVIAPKAAPNVVVIMLDDVGFADLGCYGGEIETPRIDQLA